MSRSFASTVANIPNILRNKKTFYAIVVLFVLEALWIALTSHYPMAFDEDYHLGIIKIYSHHSIPFLSSQPAGADIFGAVARDPSYLYHYLMSFVYRIINFFTKDQTVIVLALRCINIGLFAASLFITRKLFSRFAPPAVTHGVLLFFIFIPVVPLLAAQINYDNLFIPVISLSLLSAHTFVDKLTNEHKFSWEQIMTVTALLLFGSLVKYAFLPVAFVITLYILVTYVKCRSGLEYYKPKISNKFFAISITLLLLTILFSQRYLVNVIKYKTPIPSCNKVLSIDQCSNYGPWARDYRYEHSKVIHPHNVVVYAPDWFYGMWLRLYFALDGPGTHYQTRSPLPVPAITGIVVAFAAAIGIIIGAKTMLRSKDRSIILLVALSAGVYISVLFVDNYQGYVKTGQPVAINGRYLLPFIPILLALGGLGLRNLYLDHKKFATSIALLLLAGGLYGGGTFTYILRSNDSWYWHNPAVYSMNHFVKNVMGPITPGYKQPTQFLR